MLLRTRWGGPVEEKADPPGERKRGSNLALSLPPSGEKMRSGSFLVKKENVFENIHTRANDGGKRLLKFCGSWNIVETPFFFFFSAILFPLGVEMEGIAFIGRRRRRRPFCDAATPWLLPCQSRAAFRPLNSSYILFRPL